MIHRMLRYPAGWEWHVLQQARQQAPRQEPLPSRKHTQKQPSAAQGGQAAVKAALIVEKSSGDRGNDELKRQFPECRDWIDDCADRRNNIITVGETEGLEPLLFGTLMFQVSEDQSDVQPFHFWLSRERLLTMHDDMRLPLRLQSVQHTSKFESCGSAPEALFVMVGIILETFHEGLDGFEKRLGELEATMRRENRTGLIDIIFERRYDLLHWSHLFIPVRELHGAAKEAFMEKLTETDGFKRITHKLERIDALLKHYALEIDTLISMDDAISSFRGNDIMKTLTIFTVMFLPATVASSLWGTNFNKLAWKEEPWGFPVMIVTIFVITIVIYVWLWKKGWTGDLLNGRKPSEIVAGQADSKRRGTRRTKDGRREAGFGSADRTDLFPGAGRQDGFGQTDDEPRPVIPERRNRGKR
ncbi:magnesium transporter CorA family protein [Paenibacillus sp. N4]|uniref:magnesium transporter CorA family protein n=1 Tax=Paenibacillus vietnamensis TaxID=2590547 RepID=UPI001CD055A2|nr:magnesium transporter CorA family protein [Paenibacillus vietnamensis]MCA0756670.1 magnesium transporter CorA family protein [Paenibacillus vietnamensis]